MKTLQPIAAKIGLTLGVLFGIAGVYALWFAFALGVPPLAGGIVWLFETKTIYLVLIAAWVAYVCVSAFRQSRS